MISLIDRLPGIIRPDCAAAIRIMSVFNAYSQYKIARFWTQICEDMPTAVICRIDGDVTVFASEDADAGEIAGFINAIGCLSATCNRPLPLGKEKTVTQLVTSRACKRRETTAELSSVYNIMSTCFEMPPYDVWYADMSHRIRHGSASAVSDGHSAACAFIAEGSALIVGLCTLADERGNGHAAKLLEDLMSETGCDRFFVLAEDELVDFYVNQSFSKNGKHYLYYGDA